MARLSDQHRADQLLIQHQLHPDDLARLAQWTGVKTLHIPASCALPPQPFAPLRTLPHLFTLEIVDRTLTQADLHDLGQLSALRSLSLEGCVFDEADLAALTHLPHLWYLSLRRTPLTGIGLAALSRCTMLAYLYLSATAINDADLLHMELLQRLSGIELDGTAITDAGLFHLAVLPLLGPIIHRETAITMNGMDAMRCEQVRLYLEGRARTVRSMIPSERDRLEATATLYGFLTAVTTWAQETAAQAQERDTHDRSWYLQPWFSAFKEARQAQLLPILARFCVSATPVGYLPIPDSMYDVTSTEILAWYHTSPRRMVGVIRMRHHYHGFVLVRRRKQWLLQRFWYLLGGGRWQRHALEGGIYPG